MIEFWYPVEKSLEEVRFIVVVEVVRAVEVVGAIEGVCGVREMSAIVENSDSFFRINGQCHLLLCILINILSHNFFLYYSLFT